MKYHVEQPQWPDTFEAHEWRVYDKQTGAEIPMVRGFDTDAGTVTVLRRTRISFEATEHDYSEITLERSFRIVNIRTGAIVAETAK